MISEIFMLKNMNPHFVSADALFIDNEPLAFGSHSTVHCCQYHDSPAVVKLFNQLNSGATTLLQDEISRSFLLNSDNTIRSLAMTNLHNRIGLVMEKANATLSHLLPASISPTTISLAIDIVDALMFIHSNNIVHYDLKPSNILLCGLQG
ncbi:hypothetical protein GEMRC1_013814 [Eukaryota sp. GEM-RC1]